MPAFDTDPKVHAKQMEEVRERLDRELNGGGEIVVHLTRAEADALLTREQPSTMADHPAWSATRKLKEALGEP